jgi:hypothetical protein
MQGLDSLLLANDFAGLERFFTALYDAMPPDSATTRSAATRATQPASSTPYSRRWAWM